MWSHVFGYYWIYDPLAHTLGLYSITRYKGVVDIVFCILYILGLGIRGTHLKSSIQDIVDEVAPIKKKPPYGVEGRFIRMWCHETYLGPLTLFPESNCPKIAIWIIHAYFSSARMILLEWRESPAQLLGSCSLLYTKNIYNVTQFPTIDTQFYALAWKKVWAFVKLQHYGDILKLRFLLFVLWQIIQQTCCHVNYHKKNHRQRLQDIDQIFVQCWWARKQGHNNVYVSHGYIQTRNLILKHLDMLTWYNKSSPSCILHVKNLQQKKIMLDNIFISWIFLEFFHTSSNPLQILICASWLYAKFKLIMDVVFLTRHWYFFNTLGSTLKGGVSLDSFAMSQKSMDANNSFILKF